MGCTPTISFWIIVGTIRLTGIRMRLVRLIFFLGGGHISTGVNQPSNLNLSLFVVVTIRIVLSVVVTDGFDDTLAHHIDIVVLFVRLGREQHSSHEG